MKKYLAIVSIVGAAYGAMAQGEVSFINTSSAATKISVNSTPGGAATSLTTAGAGNYYFELFYSADNATTVTGSGSGAVIPPATAESPLTGFVNGDAADWTDTTLLAPDRKSVV